MSLAKPDNGCTRTRAEKRSASASPQSRAYSHSAGLSSQSGCGRAVLLHGERTRPPVGFADHPNRRVAGCGSASSRPRAVPRRTPGSCFPTTCTAYGPCRKAMPISPAVGARSRGFSKSVRSGEPRSPVMTRRGERGVWQRRYREHTIRDDRDFAAHIDYTHFNPVKHGLVEHPAEWPHSSFHRCVAGGLYPAGGCAAPASRRRRVSGDEIETARRAQAERTSRPALLDTVRYADDSQRRRCAFPRYACCFLLF
jgi:hypothetical protein